MYFEIEYPADFKTRVKAEFPHNKQLHKKLDKNSLDVVPMIRHLNEEWHKTITPVTIVNAFASANLDELKSKAEKIVRISDLAYECECYYLNYTTGKGNRRAVNVDHSRGLCQEPNFKPPYHINNIPREVAEKDPPTCKCCGQKMKIQNMGSESLDILGMFYLVCEICPPNSKHEAT